VSRRSGRRPAGPAGALLAIGLGLALTACSSDGGGGTGADAIAITSTATECRVATPTVAAGKHTFTLENTGTAVTEVYIYASGDKVVTEKENVGPGTKATFSATLKAGQYEVACKPGQTGNGIRQPLTVT
jgi:iron uptake system component EfeO